MGGKGSGRLNKTDTFLKANSSPFNTVSSHLASIGNEVLVVPNHSGISTHPEAKNNFIFKESEIDDGNSSTADTIDFSAGLKHKSTLTGDVTYTFTNPSKAANLILKLVQDGTGGRAVTWPASVKWQRGIAPDFSNSAASSTDVITLYYDGTNYYANVGYAFA